MKPVCLLTCLAAVSVGQAARAAPAEPLADLPPTPETIAIVDEGPQGVAIRHFPSRLRLYTFDRDSPGVSRCTEGCATAWPPVRATLVAKPIGDWTLVERDDHTRQWAYKGRPVYVRFHDQPDAPGGDGVDGLWHIIPNIPAPAP
jgi:predicted lipoprotein with Yx(FWY)xxD motif